MPSSQAGELDDRPSSRRRPSTAGRRR
jgi:hypothetical protein